MVMGGIGPRDSRGGDSARDDRSTRIALGAMILFGLMFLLVAVLVMRPATGVPEGWATVDGRVVGEQVSWSGDSEVAYPIVEYTDPRGDRHRVTSGVGSSIRSKIGDSMTVAYDPANPADGRVTGGMASMAWVLFAGVGCLFAALGGLLLAGTVRRASGRTESDVLLGGAVRRAPDGRESFTRARLRSWINIYGELAGGLLLLFVALFLAPGGPFTILGLAFAAILLLGALWAFRRRDEEVAEVSPDGLVTPELGFRRWDELAEIRIERYPGTSAADRGYRRLGLVPRDPSLAQTRSGSERAMWAIVRPMLYTYTAAGVPVDDPAPFGISEQELGTQAFEQLLTSIGRHHEVVGHAPPLAMPDVIEAALPSLAATSGPVLTSAPAVVSSRIGTGLGEVLGVAQVFVVLGLVGRMVTAALVSPSAPQSLPVIAVILLVSVVIAFRPVRALLGKGVAGGSRVVLVACAAIGAGVGVALPELFGWFAGV
jgi:hypothetical protein